MEEALLGSKESTKETKTKEEPLSLNAAIKQILPAAATGYLFSIFEKIGNSCNLYFMSKENDPLIVAAIGFGNTWMMMFSLGLSFSFSSGLATLVAQSYGAKKLKLCAYTLHKGFVIAMLVFVLFLLTLLFFPPVLRILKYDPSLISTTLGYTMAMIPAQFGGAIFILLRMYAAGFQVFNLPVYIQMVFSVLEMIISYVLVYQMELGFVGLGCSRGFSEIGRTIVLYYYMKKDETFQDTLCWFEEGSFEGMKEQMKYQFYTGMITYIDLLTYLIGEMFIASMDLVELDASFCFISTLLIFIHIPMSVAGPASSFIGNSVGKQDYEKVKTYILASKYMVFGAAIVLSALIFIFSEPLSMVFLKDPVINAKIQALFIMYSLFMVFDCGQMFLPAVTRALGEENSSFKIMIVTDLIIGLAFQFFGGIVFKGGALGTWIGMQMAFSLNFVLQYRLLSQIDIKEAIARVQANLKEKEEKTKVPNQGESAIELKDVSSM